VRDTDNQRVAIKALHRRYASDREQIATLKHEFAVGRQMRHKYVCRVFEYNEHRKTPYIVMEFMTPCSMKHAIRDKHEQIAWQIPEVIQRGAEGLSYFHLRGWVHRDIKPDNFLLGDEGEVKLIDFSIAQKQKRGISKLLFGRGKVQGTRSYMAPEQIRGEVLDPRSDMYSFGCTIYELITGRLPYTGTSSQELLNKHLKASIPSLIAVDDNVTPQFNTLVMQTLAKRRDQRPESMDKFLKELAGMRVFHNRPRKPDSRSDEDE
jgi:serine/threonine-protein kinase